MDERVSRGEEEKKGSNGTECGKRQLKLKGIRRLVREPSAMVTFSNM